jgi:hypothetical protein
VVKHPATQTALKRIAQRLEHFCVGGLNQAGGLRLSFQRQAAQIGSDAFIKRQVQSAVDPRRNRLDFRCGSAHPAS